MGFTVSGCSLLSCQVQLARQVAPVSGVPPATQSAQPTGGLLPKLIERSHDALVGVCGQRLRRRVAPTFGRRHELRGRYLTRAQVITHGVAALEFSGRKQNQRLTRNGSVEGQRFGSARHAHWHLRPVYVHRRLNILVVVQLVAGFVRYRSRLERRAQGRREAR